jgi:hypothetical protein
LPRPSKPFTRVVVKPDIPGLSAAQAILTNEMQAVGQKIGKEGVRRITRIQRIASGEERRRTKFRVVTRKGQLNVELYNTVIQAAVDETGAKPHFPPYKAGSPLFRWVSRKGLASRPSRQTRQAASRGLRGVEARVAANQDAANRVKQIERISFLIARAISRRGLPRPGDKLRKPFETVRRGFDAYATGEIAKATTRAVNRINNYKGGRR